MTGVCVPQSMAADDSEGSEKKRPEPPPIEFLKPGETQAQAPPPQQQPVAWVTRPEDYQQPAYTVGPAPPRPAAAGKLGLAAGVFLLLAGALGVAAAVYSSITPLPVSQYVNLTSNPTDYLTSQICSLVIIWSQTAAILGGVMAIQRLNWKLTMVCAIFATLTVGFYLEASFLGMVGFVLVLLARKEFRS